MHRLLICAAFLAAAVFMTAPAQAQAPPGHDTVTDAIGVTGHAYLGHCDQAGKNWSEVNFSGLPACDSLVVSAPITAMKGVKVHDRLPAAGNYGHEIRRLRRGEKVSLKSIHLKPDGSAWGQISCKTDGAAIGSASLDC